MSDDVMSAGGSRQGSGRLLSIDLLRAVAAFGVFVFHASLTAGFDKFSLSVHIPGLDRALAIPNFLSLGAMGVSLFFVVSGYCLARSRGRAVARSRQRGCRTTMHPDCIESIQPIFSRSL